MKKLLLLILPAVALAAPPYDVTVTFSPPLTGGPPDGYNLYVDDCAVSGPVGAPTLVTSGQTFPGLILADGTYDFCVRAFNAAGENPDPGQVATAVINDLPLPGPVENLGIQVVCPDSSCTINVTVN
jgi:hypothetical protein